MTKEKGRHWQKGRGMRHKIRDGRQHDREVGRELELEDTNLNE
jgi:hypothetical protein